MENDPFCVTGGGVEGDIQRFIDEINKRLKPVAFYRGLPVYENKYVPDDMVLFVGEKETVALCNVK